MAASYSIFDPSDKSRIDRLRRKAKRHDMRIEKGRGQYHSGNKGGLQLIGDGNTVLEGVCYELTLKDAEYWVDRYIRART